MRGLETEVWIKFSFAASASAGASLWARLTAMITYQVDLMMLVEDYGAMLGLQLLLLVGLHALILKNAQTSILVYSKIHVKTQLQFDMHR